MIATLAGGLSDTGPSFECQIFRTMSLELDGFMTASSSPTTCADKAVERTNGEKKCNAILLIGSDSSASILRPFRALLHLLKG